MQTQRHSRCYYTSFFSRMIKISTLRKKWTRTDVRNAQILRFAREYHGVKFRFLTLTTRREESASLRERKRHLFRSLRVFYPRLQYRCSKTDEGNGVCHICLVNDDYIPKALIEQHWNAWSSISMERDLEALLKEMSLQQEHGCYSMSRSFLPVGAIHAIEAIGRLFRGQSGRIAIEMLARRWKAPEALYRTIECCSRKNGWRSDVKTHQEILAGRISTFW